ncbi:MAG: ATP-binding protein [Gemmatimonadaceae bacterium]
MFLLVVAGLYAADRATQQSERQEAKVDAVEAAARIRIFVTSRAEALNALHGLYMGPTGVPQGEDFHVLVRSLGEHLVGLRRVWVTDSAGVVVADTALIAGARPLPPRLDVDTITQSATRGVAARARRTGTPQISRPDALLTGGRGIVIVQPISIEGRFAGFAGGTLTPDALVTQVKARPTEGPDGAALLYGRDTIVATGRRSLLRGGAYLDSAIVELPGGTHWRLVVAHESGNRTARLAIWLIGLGLLAALTVAILRESRLADRMAERSSELERLSGELLQANRAKSEFLANVSHELRTPLNAIVGFVELLRDGVYGELAPRQLGPVQRIEASANHLRTLVDQILDLAKMAAGRLEVHTEIIDLRPFALDVAGEIESLVSERRLALSMGVPATLPRVRTDPTHLRQILLNLMSNAVKYTNEGGVAVRARLVGPPDRLPAEMRVPRSHTPTPTTSLEGKAPRKDAVWIALQVSDTGIGIAPADQERIFEEFEQVNAGPRGDSMRRGTGLGLPISRRLARLIGGDVTVESEVGKGSTFTLWLPVNETDLRAPRRVSPSGRQVTVGGGPKPTVE